MRSCPKCSSGNTQEKETEYPLITRVTCPDCGHLWAVKEFKVNGLDFELSITPENYTAKIMLHSYGFYCARAEAKTEVEAWGLAVAKLADFIHFSDGVKEELGSDDPAELIKALYEEEEAEQDDIGPASFISLN